MFSALCRRNVTPGYKDEEIRDLFDLRRGVERQALIERMPELLRQRDALVEQMPDMTAHEQVAAGLRLRAIGNEVAESYARIQGPTSRRRRTRPRGCDSHASG
jgi:hypothetical protein